MFETYENRHNPHVTIHRQSCSQLRKRGGEHQYNQGRYEVHSTLEDARRHATETRLPIILCSFCKPDSDSEE